MMNILIIKLLEYNSQSKKAVFEVNGINSDEILKLLTKFQQMNGKKTNKEKNEKEKKKTETLHHDNTKSPDISILEKNHEDLIVKIKKDTTVTDVESEEELENVLKNSLRILRDEEEEDTD